MLDAIGWFLAWVMALWAVVFVVVIPPLIAKMVWDEFKPSRFRLR
jgi:hypothetical protein